MQPVGPAIPFQIARAYGLPQQQLRQATQVAPERSTQVAPERSTQVAPERSTQVAPERSTGVDRSAGVERVGGDRGSLGRIGGPDEAVMFHPQGGFKANPGVARLVAAKVPGSVEFGADGPRVGSGLSIYRSPADRNAAATGVDAGRLLDVDA